VQKFESHETEKYVSQFAPQSDLILLQEAMMGPDYDAFYNGMSKDEWIHAISFFKESQTGTGVTTATSVQPDQVLPIRSVVTEPITHTPKMILLTKYKIDGADKELLVANIHGINFVSTRKYETQIAQLEEALKKHDGPIILAGDFNTYLLERTLIVGQMAKRLGLKYVDIDNRSITSVQLDHIFVRGLERLSAISMLQIKSSDHHPLYARLKLE
jgi:endonuclease/exonuclease/phosphatase (EEP) superfamily protein YafD